MEQIPFDVMIIIFNYLKECIEYIDELYLYRLVSKKWDYAICQATTKLPIKFWYWFARKSLEDSDVSIPLYFTNLSKINLYTEKQIYSLATYVQLFRGLHTIDLRQIPYLSSESLSVICAIKNVLIKTLSYIIIGGNFINYDTPSITYESFQNKYCFSLTNTFGGIKLSGHHLKEVVTHINKSSFENITKIIFNRIELSDMIHLCVEISKLYHSVKKIKYNPMMRLKLDDISEAHHIFELFPNLLILYSHDSYINRINYIPIIKSKDRTVLNNLICSQYTRQISVYYNDIYCDCNDVILSDLWEFIKRNNLSENKKWLDKINNITFMDINFNDLQITKFIRIYFLNILQGGKIYLRFEMNSKGQICYVIEWLDALLRNNSSFCIKTFSFSFHTLRVSDFISLMKTHKCVFFDNDMLQEVVLSIQYPINKPNNHDYIPDIVKKYYEVKINNKTYIFTKKKSRCRLF